MINTLRERIDRFPAIAQPLRNLIRSLRARPIIKHLKHKQSVFFVQVGSNDGLQGDPICGLINRYSNWRGMLIEPVPFIFERLKQNYNYSDRFIFENVAISNKSGSRKFYYVSRKAKEELGDKLPYWHDQLGSFDKNHILKHIDGILEPYIVETEVETITLPELLDKNNVDKIDLLHIDTEGYDYKVLSQVDFSKYRPSVILYEDKHLSTQEKYLAKALLNSADYICIRFDALNTLAYAIG